MSADIVAITAYICIGIMGCLLMLVLRPWIVLTLVITPMLVAVHTAANYRFGHRQVP